MADHSPPNCGSNSLDLTLTKDRTVVRNGDRMNYTVEARNDAGSACDVTGVTISLTLPGRDGRPTGQTVTLTTNANYPAGTGPQRVGTVPYTVDIAPGVQDAVAEARAAGKLHDAPTDHDASILKTVGTTATQPSATLTGTATPSSGDSPLQTTFTYTVTNNSSTPAPLNPQSGGIRGDDVCSNLTRTGGDTDNDNQLDVGESWTYSCTTTLTQPGNTTSHATAVFTNSVDNLPVTIPPAEATASVLSTPTTTPPATTTPPTTTTPPSSTPSNPASGVLGKRLASPDSRAARGDAACIAVPRSLRIRARERTLVRVRVTDEGAPVRNALVRVLGPGYARRKVTNANGVARFRVRTRRAGRLVIQSDRCLGADRITVRGARRTSGNQTPQGTG